MDWELCMFSVMHVVVVLTRFRPQKQLDIRMRKKIIVCEYCGRIMIDPELAGVIAEQHLETVKR